jgi:hypothetical protein
MRDKRHAAEPVDGRALQAGDDARQLAMELAGLQPVRSVDPVGMRVVLEPDEDAWRQLDHLWFTAIRAPAEDVVGMA